MNIKEVGGGTVVLISGGGKIYTDIAARFVKSERSLSDIIDTPYTEAIVENIINNGHMAATEFDYFIFGIEGYSRVTEAQLIRKRIASYLIKSGRCEHCHKRQFNVVYPESLDTFTSMQEIVFANPDSNTDVTTVKIPVTATLLTQMIENWYEDGITNHIKEEELRYLKPQGTEFKAIIGMNTRALYDFFAVRCCKNAQTEIRDLANKMLKLCKKAAPTLFKDAGPNCKRLGYCPENKFQHKDCKTITKDEALVILSKKIHK